MITMDRIGLDFGGGPFERLALNQLAGALRSLFKSAGLRSPDQRRRRSKARTRKAGQCPAFFCLIEDVYCVLIMNVSSFCLKSVYGGNSVRAIIKRVRTTARSCENALKP